MAGDRLRVRRSLDPHSLVRPERGADRQHKNNRQHPRRSMRRLVRTPVGAAVAVGVLAAASVGVALAAGGRSNPPRPVAGSTPPSAVPGVNLPPTSLPDACTLLTQQLAEQTVGRSLTPLGSPTATSCGYFTTDQTSSVGLYYVTSTASQLRASLDADQVSVSPRPEVGPGGLFSAAFDRPARSGSGHQYLPARVYLPIAGQWAIVFVGSTDGQAHVVDPAGDERRVIELAKTLFPPGGVAGS